MERRNAPSSPGFIDRFSDDDEPRASGELWERELQRLLISDGLPQGSDESLIERLVDSGDGLASSELEKLLTTDMETQPGDAALVERLVDGCLDDPATEQHRPARGSGRGLRRTLWLAAAIPLIGAIGFAASGVFERERAPAPTSKPKPAPETKLAPPPKTTKPQRPELPAETQSVTRQEKEESNAPLPPVTSRETRENAKRADPLYLFKDLKAARASAKMGTFFELGRQLQREFPSSDEAQVSRMLLGRALLQGGSNAAALKQFDGYRSRGGAMLEEAIVGQARASAGLGLHAKELQAWRALIKKFPTSVHAPRAKQRLADLMRK